MRLLESTLDWIKATRLLEWIHDWPGAEFLRASSTAYLFVNAAHILGIGLLLGSILPLDLRLTGLFRTVPLAAIGPFLLRVATIGLTTAIVTGLCLFSVKPTEYIANTAFLAKMTLLATAALNIALQHRGSALVGGEITARVRVHAAVSALLWLSVLVAGRWIGFV
jgi:hypothetical protein